MGMATDIPTATDPVHGGEADRWGGWTWRKPRGGDHFRTCSYCGSIHPEDLAAEIIPAGACLGCGAVGFGAHYSRLLEAAEPQEHPYDPGGAYPSWADQKYGWPHKFYVEGLRPRDPARMHCFGHAHGDSPPQVTSVPWVAAKDLTREQKKIIREDGMIMRGEKPDGWYSFRPKTTLFAKFYTRHLADPALPAEVKAKIEDACGLRFHFSDGAVLWHAAGIPCEEAQPAH